MNPIPIRFGGYRPPAPVHGMTAGNPDALARLKLDETGISRLDGAERAAFAGAAAARDQQRGAPGNELSDLLARGPVQ